MGGLGGVLCSQLWWNLFSLTSFRFQWVRCLHGRGRERRIWGVAVRRRRARSGQEGEGGSTGETQSLGCGALQAMRGAASRRVAEQRFGASLSFPHRLALGQYRQYQSVASHVSWHGCYTCSYCLEGRGRRKEGAAGVGHLVELERRSAESRVRFAHFPERNMFSRAPCKAGGRRGYGWNG